MSALPYWTHSDLLHLTGAQNPLHGVRLPIFLRGNAEYHRGNRRFTAGRRTCWRSWGLWVKM